ncbi:hypothetical protein Goe2_c07800 [Bacillus phage vB_BsuM-Goe2]|uniref:Uncharacterized protein n=1 Tax=Bacillus phage vB_BsuM-Goe2 TaxID=1933062 RepID=A0A217EQK3_9CAUD|nr:hypothetical protein Goe2_c07800 [Bacillus phage vB_BsuM-Goe2]
MKYEDINSTFLRENYLFGVPLEDQYGNKMKEGMLDHYIKSAIEYTQRMLNIVIKPTEVTHEVHDYYAGDYTNWSFLQLNKRPIMEVSQLSMYFGESKMFDIPVDWVRIYDIPGQLQLFPTSGTTSVALTGGGSFLPFVLGTYSSAPGVWRVSYKAGLEDIPEDMVEYIMKRASIGILQVWGDLIIGAGIANTTLSIDGLSQSIGTTQSPEFSGAGSRIKNYQDDMKDLEKRLKDTYVGINLGVI